MAEPTSTRERILRAASELALQTGPGNLSLDAVAARAGLSKGGLLYNFPTKAKLLEAVVEDHLAAFEAELAREEKLRDGDANALASAYLAVVRRELGFKKGPPAGILAAMAEDPSFMEPVRRFNRAFLDRIAATGMDDRDTALVAFLAVEGLRLTQLIGIDVMTEEERGAVLERLNTILG